MWGQLWERFAMLREKLRWQPMGRDERANWISPTELASRFPEYLMCPYCDEPEVEVWDCEELTTCHNCGRSFTCANGQAVILRVSDGDDSRRE